MRFGSAPAPLPPSLPAPASAPTPQAGAETRQTEQTAAAPPSAPQPAARKQTVGVIDFQGTPLQAVLEYYATQLAKRSIIAAPNLSGTVYFRSQTDLTVEEAMQAIESVLAINGIAVVPMGEKFLKVVQIGSAKQEGVPFAGSGHEMPAADILSTQIIPMQYAEVADVISAIQPYMHPYGQLLALTKSNAILITETAANVDQMLEIIKAVDVPSALRMETKIYILSHAKAADVMQRLQSIIQEALQIGAGAAGTAQPNPVPTPIRFPRPPGQAGGQPAGTASGEGSSLIEGKVIMTADERTNKLFILSRPTNYAFFDKIISELDAKVEPDVIMKVISLNYATAEDAASLVNALITGGSVSSSSSTRKASSSSSTTRTAGAAAPPPPPPALGGGGGGGAGTGNAGFLQYAEGVRILPDARTNSLLVMATKEDMIRIEQLIRSVDTSVAQVQIEVVIAEVTLNNELDVGVDFFKNLFNYRSTTQAGGSSTDGNAPVPLASSILSSNVTAAALAAGTGGLTWFTTFRNLSLDTVVHALASTSNSKVLSTPVIQTLDNQEADILVGESVPVPVSTESSLVSSVGGTLNTGTALNSNIEYKDVAIELTVTPRINPDGYVRMDISQKVNDLGANVNISGTTVPTILKREAKSSVAVQDRSTIVLGGLIKEQKTVTTTKVPILGDIPFFGQAFKSQQNNKQRTELIIFIRPTVMRTDAEAVAAARRRARMLRAGQELDLEQHFERILTNSPSSTLTNLAPQSINQRSDTGVSSPAGDESFESQKQAAKVKALDEQVGPSN